MTQPSYDFTPIFGPLGAHNSGLVGINNSGQIFGDSGVGSSEVPFIYAGGNYAALSFSAGFGPFGINDQGQVFGINIQGQIQLVG
jgi:hypothetical protein